MTPTKAQSSRNSGPRERTHDGQAERASAEARAEELLERVTGRVSSFVTRVAGRTREEFEDILAEARTVNDRWRSSGRP